ncbi:IPTL-CTERM sorting domain-containing protein [Pseudorhodoferax sp.]|uniref:IPTL-CTERM sorting domain-containing protein n=1 Tax=Pseudorhodoferax sp. TaxID=1993553 RepID=UPI002DD65CF4|nr:IPTL-CTERM sorting domain-containing protein [Pseudorhodoferax sp.]
MTHYASLLSRLSISLAISAALLPSTQAATFRTFLNDPAGMTAAVGPGSIQSVETFANVVDGKLLTATPDPWNSFTVEVIGAGNSPTQTHWGFSHYCQNLASASCINWNVNAPAVPGVYALVNTVSTGVSIKLSSPTIAGFSFSFSDWNDPIVDNTQLVERSYFEVVASDGTTVEVHGAPQLIDAPPQTFGVVLSAADIAAGVYLREIRWVGLASPGEVVGFYHFATFTNPVLASSLKPIPTLGPVGLVALSTAMAGAVVYLRRRKKARPA